MRGVELLHAALRTGRGVVGHAIPTDLLSRDPIVWHMLSRMPHPSLQDRSPIQPERHVRLFRNGRNQALRIPRELELDADEAIVRKDGDRLIVEPVRRRPDLATLLAGWEPLDEILPDVDDGLLPLDDIRL